MAARAILAETADAIPKSGQGEVEMIRMLKSAKDSAVKVRTQANNQTEAMIVTSSVSLRECLDGLSVSHLVTRCRSFRMGFNQLGEVQLFVELGQRVVGIDDISQLPGGELEQGGVPAGPIQRLPRLQRIVPAVQPNIVQLPASTPTFSTNLTLGNDRPFLCRWAWGSWLWSGR